MQVEKKIYRNPASKWILAKQFRGKENRHGLVPVVEVTYRESGKTVVFSFTPKVEQNGELVPAIHMRGDMISQYVTMLNEAALLAQNFRARWDVGEGKERLAAGMFEVAVENSRRRRRRHGE